jgi:hypothetical protein
MWILISLFITLVLYSIYQTIRDIQLLRTVTQLNRGTRSERNLILKLLKDGFSSNDIFHDLYIRKRDGTYSQVDIVVLTEVGVIVVEVKDFSGWIFGFGKNVNWVHFLGKMKYSFYNPIFQNEGHIRTIKNQLVEYGNIPFYSLIIFYGKCEIKKVSDIPIDTMIIKSKSSIKTFNTIIQNNDSWSCYNLYELREIFNSGVCNGSIKEIKSQHIQDIKKYS